MTKLVAQFVAWKDCDICIEFMMDVLVKEDTTKQEVLTSENVYARPMQQNCGMIPLYERS